MNKVNPVVLTVAVLLALGPVATRASSTEEKKETKKVEMRETSATAHRAGHRRSIFSNKDAMRKEAKISMDQARATALNAAPGKVESGELEREHGKLIYSFDIRNAAGTIDEVNVNAIDGTIVAVEHENKAKEAAEKKQEAMEKKTVTKKTRN